MNVASGRVTLVVQLFLADVQVYGVDKTGADGLVIVQEAPSLPSISLCGEAPDGAPSELQTEDRRTWVFVARSPPRHGHPGPPGLHAASLTLDTLAAHGCVTPEPAALLELGSSPLGSGSYAEVYRAWCRQDSSDQGDVGLVLKILKPQPNREKCYRQLVSEVATLSMVQGHPNVVPFYGLFRLEQLLPPSEEPTRRWRWGLMLEHCAGGDLKGELSRGGRFKEDATLCVVRDMLSALAHVHTAGVIHRDVKAQNVLRTGSGKLLLADFGVACRLSDKEALSHFGGTVGYMAPEGLVNRRFGPKTDTFALGVLMYYCITGTLPFAAKSVAKIVRRTRKCQVEYEGTPFDTVSASCRDCVQALLQRDDALRPTASEAMAQLAWLQVQQDVTTAVSSCNITQATSCNTQEVDLAGSSPARRLSPNNSDASLAGPASSAQVQSAINMRRTRPVMSVEVERLASFSSMSMTPMSSMDCGSTWKDAIMHQEMGSDMMSCRALSPGHTINMSHNNSASSCNAHSRAAHSGDSTRPSSSRSFLSEGGERQGRLASQTGGPSPSFVQRAAQRLNFHRNLTQGRPAAGQHHYDMAPDVPEHGPQGQFTVQNTGDMLKDMLEPEDVDKESVPVSMAEILKRCETVLGTS